MRQKGDVSQFSEFLAEAPALRVEVRDWVVGEVELQEWLQAIERSAIHLPQTVEVQVPSCDKTRPDANHIIFCVCLCDFFREQ